MLGFIDISTILLAFNIAVFLIYGFDKLMAKRKGGRVPEIVLLLLSIFFGGVGAAFGMLVFNHKTSKFVFRILVPLSVFLNYFLYIDSFYLLKRFLQFLLSMIP